MCPCDLTRYYICSSCTEWLEERIFERRRLEAREQTCTVEDYDRLRHVRGVLLRAELKAEIVEHKMNMRAAA